VRCDRLAIDLNTQHTPQKIYIIMTETLNYQTIVM
jgi:hypothetical protein